MIDLEKLKESIFDLMLAGDERSDFENTHHLGTIALTEMPKLIKEIETLREAKKEAEKIINVLNDDVDYSSQPSIWLEKFGSEDE